MKKLDLNVKKRDNTGKNKSRRLRRSGLIPAVVYGLGNQDNLKVKERGFEKLLENPDGINVLLNLQGEDWEEKAIIKSIQREPVHDEVIHIDFMVIDEDKPLKISVPVILDGLAEGVKEGGILAQQLDELTIESLPKDLPASISVDVTELDLGDSLYVSDIEVEEDIDIIDEENKLVANIVMPTEEEEEEEEEEELLLEAEGELAEEELEEGEEAEEAAEEEAAEEE